MLKKIQILCQYSTIYAIRILLQVYTKEVSTGSGVTASSNRGSDKGPVWTRIPRNGYFLLLRYSSRFPLALWCGRASLAVVSLADFCAALQLLSRAIVTVIVCGCLKLLFRNFFSFLCDASWERRRVFLSCSGEAVKKKLKKKMWELLRLFSPVRLLDVVDLLYVMWRRKMMKRMFCTRRRRTI